MRDPHTITFKSSFYSDNKQPGLGGLASLKECLAEGFEAEILEVRPEIGGQWAYQPVPQDGSEVYSTMYDGVILNSCRDTSSFSDFPLDPAQYGDYFSHRQMLRYLHDYADHFGLMKHVHLQTKVTECRPNDDKTWTLKFEKDGKPVEEKTYDAVFAATGNHSDPSIPDFAGREEYKGRFMHSKFYRTPGAFEGKRVAVIGLGSGAVDIASELSIGCKEVHVVTRRGGWILPRYVLGKPIEAWDGEFRLSICDLESGRHHLVRLTLTGHRSCYPDLAAIVGITVPSDQASQHCRGRAPQRTQARPFHHGPVSYHSRRLCGESAERDGQGSPSHH